MAKKALACSTQTTLLIDGDILAYEFANRGQRVYNWGDDVVSAACDDIADVVPGIKTRIRWLLDRLEAQQVVICLTPSPDTENFRKKLLPTYKANRPVKPLLLPAVREWLQANYKVYLKEGIEADDSMGILSTHPTLIPGKKIIVSEDKDLKTIPGWLYVPRHDQLFLLEDEDADYYHLLQTLTGDATDNYKGCPGIGPVKADKILTSCTRSFMWRAVVEAYESKGLTADDALVQARVARILRHNEYDFKRKEPILWEPPTP